MSRSVELLNRLLVGFLELFRLLAERIVSDGSPVAATLLFCGLAVWVVTFGIAGYVTVRGLLP